MTENQKNKHAILVVAGQRKGERTKIMSMQPNEEVLFAKDFSEAQKILAAERGKIRAVIFADILETGVTPANELIKKAKEGGAKHFAYQMGSKRPNTAQEFGSTSTMIRGTIESGTVNLGPEARNKSGELIGARKEMTLEEFMHAVTQSTRENIQKLNSEWIVVLGPDDPGYKEVAENSKEVFARWDAEKKAEKKQSKNPLPELPEMLPEIHERKRSKRLPKGLETPSRSKEK